MKISWWLISNNLTVIITSLLSAKSLLNYGNYGLMCYVLSHSEQHIFSWLIDDGYYYILFKNSHFGMIFDVWFNLQASLTKPLYFLFWKK